MLGFYQSWVPSRLAKALRLNRLRRATIYSYSDARFPEPVPHKRLMTALVIMMLVVALAVPLVIWAGPQGGGQGGTTAAKKDGGGERHPAIHEAIRQLEHSKATLQREAARDFEGHRAKAVEHIEQALAELRQALQADKK